jgi:glycosyltransferase involved in cell wall biosynthesis
MDAVAGEARAAAGSPRLPTVGYVFSSRLAPPSASGPRAEYEVFLARHATARPFDATYAEASFPITRTLVRRGQLGLATALSALLTRPRPRCLLASGEDVGLWLALLTLALPRAPRLAIVVHGSYFASPKFGTLMRLVRRHPRVLYLPLSATLGQTLVQQFGVPARQVVNTSYGVDTDFLDPAREPAPAPADAPPLVVSAGAANRDYGRLLRVARELGPAVRFNIAAGSTWFPPEPDETVPDVPPNVVMRACPYPALRGLLRAASFVVVPLHPARHACGYAAIGDALAMGKPVLASRTEHYSDLIAEGQTGEYVAPEQDAALREAIQRWLAEPRQVEAWGAAARARMVEHFSLERYVSRLEQAVLAAEALPG